MPPTSSAHKTRPPEWTHLPDEGLEVPGESFKTPGRTPPAESGVTALDAPEREALSHGWAWTPVILIMLVVAIFLAGVIGMAVELLI
ncbi:DUF6480 family protein [Streptomyces sp. NPDC020917]|uniref:DUF6480 family protein n=1 Tax=Streptomyces sp. NPDC020917 TaxID=3365102 RepID=UPI0037A79093